jgi:hypothetical protein
MIWGVTEKFCNGDTIPSFKGIFHIEFMITSVVKCGSVTVDFCLSGPHRLLEVFEIE